VICGDAEVEGAKEAMRKLLLRGQRKVHWKDESDERRDQIVETIVGIDVQHLVVVRNAQQGEPSERRRHKCLERLLPEPEQRSVSRIVMESRGGADNNRDLQFLQDLRASRRVSTRLRRYHARGKEEPLLWLPDAICGAVVKHRTGEPRSLKKSPDDRLTIIEIGERR